MPSYGAWTSASTQFSPVHRVGMHGISNGDTHLYPLHNNTSVHLRTTTEVQRSGRITNGIQGGWRALRDYALPCLCRAICRAIPITIAGPFLENLHQSSRNSPAKNSVSGLTASAPVLNISVPPYTNGVWPLLRLVSVTQKNRASTMLSSNVQSIEHPTDCTA